MKVAFVLALAVTFIGGKLSVPVGQEKTGQELATRCVVEVLSKALSKANAPPVHPQCRDFLRAGLKHETEKKREEETAPFEGRRSQEQDEVRRQAEVTNIRGGDPQGDTEEAEYAENFLKALQEDEHHLQNGGSQETITSSEEKRSTDYHANDDEEDGASKHSHQNDEVVREVSVHSDQRSREPPEEKRSDTEDNDENTREIWGPAHGHHQNKHRRSGDSFEEGASEKSEESETEEREKRIWKPTHRYHHKKHRRSGDSYEDEASEEETEDREKRIWKPTHRYHHKKHRRSGDSYEDEASEEETEDREKRIWKPTHRYHHKKHRRSGDSYEDEHYIDPEEDEDEEKQVWNLAHEVQDLKNKRKRGSSEEEDQDLLSMQERNHEFSEDDEAKAKRIWRPTHTYHPHKERRKGDSSEEEERRNIPDEGEEDEREKPYYRRKKEDQSSEMLEDDYKRHNLKGDEDLSKRHYHLEERRYSYGDEIPHHDESDKDEGEELQEDKAKVLRFLVKRGDGAEGQSEEEEEERSPWEEQEYHHPAWWKHSPARGEMEESNQADLDWWGGRQAAVETDPPHLQETRPHLSSEMVELAKLLNHKKAGVPGILQPQKSRSLHHRPLTPEEEKELENLAAMDIELQKIAEKIHEKERE
ncbi:secretogranin-1 [Brienomyrus brachyistius]|uniref:secretogranin-1 n=1 Tax=Brienomyrus brachyistius TaxID=42636 RepID=UPI0020B20B6D|nr:secretogranin-1 [Brienomyrus brachyistius]